MLRRQSNLVAGFSSDKFRQICVSTLTLYGIVSPRCVWCEHTATKAGAGNSNKYILLMSHSYSSGMVKTFLTNYTQMMALATCLQHLKLASQVIWKRIAH